MQPVESPPSLSESPSGGAKLEEIARTERQRVEESLRSNGMHYGSYPRFSVGVKGQKVNSVGYFLHNIFFLFMA